MSHKNFQILKQAAEIALPSDYISDKRGFWLGCIGIREDGVLVSSKNGAVEFQGSVATHQLVPNSHAEGRVLRKLGKGGILYVARVSKLTKKLTMARPCKMCLIRIKSYQVDRVYYSINENQYGIWNPSYDEDRVYEIENNK